MPLESEFFLQCESIRRDRTKEYGTGVKEIQRIVQSFNAISGLDLEEKHFALIMILTKWVRHDTSRKDDNLLDMANYIAILNEIENVED